MRRRVPSLFRLVLLLVSLWVAGVVAAQAVNETPTGNGSVAANETPTGNGSVAANETPMGNASADANATAPTGGGPGPGDAMGPGPEEAMGPAPAGGMDAGSTTLVVMVVLIALGGFGTWLVNKRYHPPGEEMRRKNRPPQAR